MISFLTKLKEVYKVIYVYTISRLIRYKMLYCATKFSYYDKLW